MRTRALTAGLRADACERMRALLMGSRANECVDDGLMCICVDDGLMCIYVHALTRLPVSRLRVAGRVPVRVNRIFISASKTKRSAAARVAGRAESESRWGLSFAGCHIPGLGALPLLSIGRFLAA